VLKFGVILFLLLFCISGCVSQRPTSGRQGITGEVIWVEGNMMPTIGDTSYTLRSAGNPVQREVYIYKAVKLDDTIIHDGSFFKSINSDLVEKVETNREGKFRVYLAPGQYSIFVLEKGQLYANTFDGDNYVHPVTVEPSKFTEIKILINYKAYY
jgi:hypothetical protein